MQVLNRRYADMSLDRLDYDFSSLWHVVGFYT